jgi:hypothetical protein
MILHDHVTMMKIESLLYTISLLYPDHDHGLSNLSITQLPANALSSNNSKCRFVQLLCSSSPRGKRLKNRDHVAPRCGCV